MLEWQLFHTYTYAYTWLCSFYSCYLFLDTLEMQNLTKSYMKTLKEDSDLHKLLLPAAAVQFTEIIGEGMISIYTLQNEHM